MLALALNELFVPLLQRQYPEINDFYLPPEGCSYRMAVVQIKKAYPGHARRVMFGIWSFLRQFMYTKFIVVVDEDVNARDWKDVIWAITTRVDPTRDTMLVDSTPIDYLDFASPVSGLGSKMGLDATNKWPGESTREWGKPLTMSPEVHLVATALLTSRHGHRLPVRAFLVAALALELEHAALAQQRREAGRAELRRFFHQPVHALIGRNAGQQVHRARRFALDPPVGSDQHLDIGAAHAGDGRVEFPARSVWSAVEQRNQRTRLQAQHLHMARGPRRQVDDLAAGQRHGAVEARHGSWKLTKQ
jgi:hypothetical protein